MTYDEILRGRLSISRAVGHLRNRAASLIEPREGTYCRLGNGWMYLSEFDACALLASADAGLETEWFYKKQADYLRKQHTKESRCCMSAHKSTFIPTQAVFNLLCRLLGEYKRGEHVDTTPTLNALRQELGPQQYALFESDLCHYMKSRTAAMSMRAIIEAATRRKATSRMSQAQETVPTTDSLNPNAALNGAGHSAPPVPEVFPRTRTHFISDEWLSQYEDDGAGLLSECKRVGMIVTRDELNKGFIASSITGSPDHGDHPIPTQAPHREQGAKENSNAR